MPTFGPNLTFHKAEATAQINRRIGETRLKYITDIPGQEALYARKRQQAVDFLAISPTPTDLTGFYLISKEVGTTAPTASELCQLWLNLDAIWEVIAGDLEDIRVPANNAVTVATSRGALESILVQFELDLTATGY